MTKGQQMRERLLESFSSLNFKEAGHVYTVQGKRLPSVSGQLKQFYTPFNPNIVYFVAGKGKYKGMTARQVKKQWDDKRINAATAGTKIHSFGEHYVMTCRKPTCERELGIVQWWMDLPDHIIPVALELKVFIDGLYAGTIDIVLMNLKTGKLIIADYKTNEVDLFKNYKGQKMLRPFGRLLDHAYNKYQLQFSHYQMALEDAGFEVESRELIWLTRDEEHFKFYKSFQTKDYTKQLRKYYGYDSRTRRYSKASY